MKKPSPIHTQTICSVCGLDWDRHGDDPKVDNCIELLKADLVKEKLRTTPALPTPYPVPYPVPYRPWTNPYPGTNPYPLRNPVWTINPTTTTSGTLSTGGYSSPSTQH